MNTKQGAPEIRLLVSSEGQRDLNRQKVTFTDQNNAQRYSRIILTLCAILQKIQTFR